MLVESSESDLQFWCKPKDENKVLCSSDLDETSPPFKPVPDSASRTTAP
jgi:hypothetical protein